MTEIEFELPSWLGKGGVDESINGTIQLVESITGMLKIDSKQIVDDLKNKYNLNNEQDFRDVVNMLNEKIMKQIPDNTIEKVTTRIFVGFPDTPIGRMNAHLGGVAFSLREYLTHKEEYDKSDKKRHSTVLDTGFR